MLPKVCSQVQRKLESARKAEMAQLLTAPPKLPTLADSMIPQELEVTHVATGTHIPKDATEWGELHRKGQTCHWSLLRAGPLQKEPGPGGVRKIGGWAGSQREGFLLKSLILRRHVPIPCGGVGSMPLEGASWSLGRTDPHEV